VTLEREPLVNANYDLAKETIVEATDCPEEFFHADNLQKLDELAEACILLFGDSDSIPPSERQFGFEDDDELDEIWENFCEMLTGEFDTSGFLSNPANREFITKIGHRYPTWYCLLLDGVDSDLLTAAELSFLANLPACYDDQGRDDECIGQHFMIAQHPNVTPEILDQLLTVEHHDPALLRWVVASNPQTSAETLATLSECSDYSWRLQGLFAILQDSPGVPSATRVSDSDVPLAIQSLVMWSLAGNPAISDDTRQKLIALQNLNPDSGPSDGYRMPEDLSQAVQAIRERASA